MKIINEKGMLFGKINLIDFIVIIMAISFVFTLYFGYKVVTKKDAKEYSVINVQVKFTDIDFDFSNIIKEGDTEEDYYGNIIGKLVSIVSSNPSQAWVIVDNKTLTAIDDPRKKELIVDLNIRCTKKRHTFYYKEDIVKIGNKIIFSPYLYNITGTIVGVGFDEKK